MLLVAGEAYHEFTLEPSKKLERMEKESARDLLVILERMFEEYRLHPPQGVQREDLTDDVKKYFIAALHRDYVWNLANARLWPRKPNPLTLIDLYQERQRGIENVFQQIRRRGDALLSWLAGWQRDGRRIPVVTSDGYNAESEPYDPYRWSR